MIFQDRQWRRFFRFIYITWIWSPGLRFIQSGSQLLKLMNTYYPELDPEVLAKHPLCRCLFYLYLIIQTEQ